MVSKRRCATSAGLRPGDHPHGILWDGSHNQHEAEGGEVQPPSITFYTVTTKGDAEPLRTIRGPRTQLDWPMGLVLDPAHVPGRTRGANCSRQASRLVYRRRP